MVYSDLQDHGCRHHLEQTDHSISSQWGSQQWYDNPIRVSPTDPNVVYSGGIFVYRSLDGGLTWTEPAQAGTNGTLMHVDEHVFAFTPDGSTLYIGNDGGMYSTTDITALRINWTELNSTLAITQFYPGLSISPSDPQVTIAGAQDNGTQRFGGSESWNNVTCGDGGFTAIDPRSRRSPTLLPVHFSAADSGPLRRRMDSRGLRDQSKGHDAVHFPFRDRSLESANVVFRDESLVADR